VVHDLQTLILARFFLDTAIHQKYAVLCVIISFVELRAQVTAVIRAFAIRVFVYPRFYFSIMRSINILSAATVEASAQAH
jgi:hypothetical protein